MKYKIEYEHKISRWDEGLPLGNGQTGCLIWGGPDQLRFSLDRTDIWDTSVPYGTEAEDFTYGNLVRLAKEKNTEKIRKIFDAPYEHPVPTKLPAGKIILHISRYADVSAQLSLQRAEAVLQLDGNTERTGGRGAGENAGPQIKSAAHARCGPKIKSVVHAQCGAGMICVGLPLDQFSIELQAPAFGRKQKAESVLPPAPEKKPAGTQAAGESRDITSEDVTKGTLKDIFYEEPVRVRMEMEAGGYVEYFRQKTNTETAFGIVMGVRAYADKTDIFYRIVHTKEKQDVFWTDLSGTGGDVFENGVQLMKNCMESGYEKLLPAHLQWWEDYWKQSSICLPDPVMEKNWYLSNYLLASCSRKGCYPMPLQGVWTADEDTLPPWKGDYHNDLNTQMSYYSYLKANHMAQGECFVDFLWDLREEGRRFARKFYGTGGLCLPAVMTIEGKPLGGWPMYSLSPANQIWLCRVFDDYYRYTKDRNFLKERAYPYFKETAECIGALLEKRPDGFFYFPVSSSPEIHDDEAGAFLTPNSNYDLALLHYLYETLERYAGLLSRQEETGQWKEIRRCLPEYAVDDRGVLMLAEDEILKESHRHFSHAHAVHPLKLIKYDTKENRRIIDAVIRDLEELGTDMWVGFSFCWMAQLYVTARRGAQAAKMLRIFWEYFCSSNGFHLNGDYKKKGYSRFDYRPFTLEGNMCAADALQEMLLYAEDGILEPFPAIPAEWMEKTVSFSNLRAEGGLLVSASLENGRLTKLVIHASRPGRTTVRGFDQSGTRRQEFVWQTQFGCGAQVLIGQQN